MIGAEKEGEKIAVEIKTFLNISFASEFHVALGQYLNYLVELEKEEPNRTLFLAVPKETFELYFYTQHIRLVIERFNLKVIAFDIESKTITKWIR